MKYVSIVATLVFWLARGGTDCGDGSGVLFGRQRVESNGIG